MRLHDLQLTKDEYNNLPHASTLTEAELQETRDFGFRFKARDGHVCELVKGEDMFQDQWASLLDVPRRGLRHYHPIFI